MLVVGLTGGIGAGKSSVARLFTQHGVPVLDADEVARDLVHSGSDALNRIRNHFGDAVITPDGELNRTRLRELVFKDPVQRNQLESILHPMVRHEISIWLAQQQACYVIVVIPLLLESGMQNIVDRVLVVDCDEALQVERVRSRDSLPEPTIRAIMAAQLPREQRTAQADDIIENSGSPATIMEKVAELDQFYRTLC